jgi:hypothetical protein
MHWRLLYDRRPLLTTFTDKVAVREYVANAIGPEVLPRVFAVVADATELDRTQLPTEFVIKPNNAASRIWIVADPAKFGSLGLTSRTPRHSHLSPNDDSLDWEQVIDTCRGWLAEKFSDRHLEWAYRNIPPRIVVEELLLDPEGKIPIDYKFFVFHGRVHHLRVISGRFFDQRCNIFSPEWLPLDVVTKSPGSDTPPERPKSLERMIRVAESLGRGMDFIRVDLYCIGERVYFGELTTYPSAGEDNYEPGWFNAELGARWALEGRRRPHFVKTDRQ